MINQEVSIKTIVRKFNKNKNHYHKLLNKKLCRFNLLPEIYQIQQSIKEMLLRILVKYQR